MASPGWKFDQSQQEIPRVGRHAASLSSRIAVCRQRRKNVRFENEVEIGSRSRWQQCPRHALGAEESSRDSCLRDSRVTRFGKRTGGMIVTSTQHSALSQRNINHKGRNGARRNGDRRNRKIKTILQSSWAGFSGQLLVASC